jgi:hyperosmotically inducible protein
MVRRSLGIWFGAVAIAFMAVSCSHSDPGVTTAVKTKLAADDTVKAYKIDVDTKDGVVTLVGTVETPAAKERAVELATNTTGVNSVVDQLTIVPPAAPTTGVEIVAPVTDAGVTTLVKTKFLADTSIAGLKIDVDTKDNVVTLTGIVPTEADKTHAVEVAQQTEGVKSVVDKLKVGNKERK